MLKKKGKCLGEVVEVVKRMAPKKKYEGKQVEYVELADISCDYLEITNSTSMYYHDLPTRTRQLPLSL